jgi:hypothetical protein
MRLARRSIPLQSKAIDPYRIYHAPDVGVLGKADSTWGGDPFEARGGRLLAARDRQRHPFAIRRRIDG